MKMKILFLGMVAMAIIPLNAQKKLTLQDAIGVALKNNYDILIAGKNAETSAVNNTAGNAGMLPTVALAGTGTLGLVHTDTKLSTGTENAYNNVRTTTLSAGAQLSWTLYDGGKMFVTKSKLAEIQTQGELQFKEQVLSTTYNVVDAYFNLACQKQQLKSIQEVLNYARERLKIAEAGLKAGTLVKTDWLQSQMDLNQNLQSEINQQYAISVAMRKLKVLLGSDDKDDFEIVDTLYTMYSPDKMDLSARILNSNASVLVLQRQIKIAELVLKENNAAYLPVVGLKAGYNVSVTDNSAGSTLHNSTTGPQVSGTLSVPVYNAGETKRKISVARIQQKIAQYDLDNLKLQLNAELENTLTEFENQQKMLQLEVSNNQLANENLQLSLQRLKGGQTTSLEVHQAQEYYVQSSTRLINYRYNLKMAETHLKQLSAEL